MMYTEANAFLITSLQTDQFAIKIYLCIYVPLDSSLKILIFHYRAVFHWKSVRWNERIFHAYCLTQTNIYQIYHLCSFGLVVHGALSWTPVAC